jgi:hypothetical protein
MYAIFWSCGDANSLCITGEPAGYSKQSEGSIVSVPPSALAEFVRNAVAQWHFCRGSVYLWTMALASVLLAPELAPYLHMAPRSETCTWT